MRAILICLPLAACTPEIASGSYLCGPDASCPDGQACNGTKDDNAGLEAETCVLESLARPFACSPQLNAEPDNTMDEAHVIPTLACVSAPFTIERGCMEAQDSADWLTFVVPSACASVGVNARLTFPYAFEELALELWDVDANMMVADAAECVQGAESGAIRRCLDLQLVPGKTYAVRVSPTGEGDCDGDCAYNRYSLSVQLGPPG
ncbi:MAG TPA: hypothetical protein VIV11_20060 [Kofleriaceae bacterium]